MTTRETVMKMNSKLHTCDRKYFTAILMTMLMLLTAQGAWAYNYTYIVINKSNKEAIRYTVSDQTAGTAPSIPKYIKSPMTLTYHYYDSSSFTDDGSGNYTQNTLTTLATLPSSAATVYVTYDNYAGSEFNLSRGKQYHISWLSTDGSTKYYMWPTAVNSAANDFTQFCFWEDGNSQIASRNLTDNHKMYDFYSANNDPYDITIYNYGYEVANNDHFFCFRSAQQKADAMGLSVTNQTIQFSSFILLNAYDNSDNIETGEFLILGGDSYHKESREKYACLQNQNQGAGEAWRQFLEPKDYLNYLFKNPNNNSDKRRFLIEEAEVARNVNVTYHVRANNWSNYLNASDLTGGDEASYTEEVALGTTIALPSALARYGTTNIQYRDSYDSTPYASGATLTANMDSNGDHSINIYVTYDIDETQLGNLLSNSSATYYHQFWFYNTTGTYYTMLYDNGKIVATEYSDISSISTADAYLWKFSGTPYLLKITNKQAGNSLFASTSDVAKNSIISLSSTNANNTWSIVKNTSNNAAANGYCFLLNATIGGTLMYFAGQTGAGITNHQAFLFPMDWMKTIYTKLVSTERNLTYHIIDRSGKHVASYSSGDEQLRLTDEWRSPFVDTYSYYTAANYDSGNDTYTVSGTALNENTAVTDGMSDIYVTYTVNSAYNLTGETDYALHFANGDNIHQESSDHPETTATAADYPYVCGSGGFFLYRAAKFTKAFADGESVRTRYTWRFYGGDPYRLKIMSPYNNDKKDYHSQATDKYNYFCTYNDANQGVVTTLTQLDRTGYNPTEYMALGTSASSMTLKTREEIGGAQQTINALQHLWKSYTETKKEFRVADELSALGVSTHSLEIDKAWFNSDGTKQDDEHFFQTVSLGTGAFALEKVEMVPVIHLLDKHGWELAFWPMDDDHVNDIKRYDSPMVKQYLWYLGEAKVKDGSDIEKVEGFYKYKLKDGLTAKAKTTSMIDWTWRTTEYLETNKDYNQNYYVIYDVKDEYAGLTYASTRPYFMVEQNGKMAVANSAAISTLTKKADNAFIEDIDDASLWILSSNPKIDTECGMENGETLTEFDPYALRIQSKTEGTYVTLPYDSNTSPVPSTSGSLSLTDGETVLTEYRSHDMNRAVTGTTFMYIEGINGYPRLASRFRETHLEDYVLSDLASVQQFTREVNSQRSRLRPIYIINYNFEDPNNEGEADYISPVGIDDETTIAATTLPSGLVRKGCTVYHFYETSFSGTELTSSNNLTTNLTDIYVKYTVDTEALGFSLSTASSTNWYTMHFVNNSEKQQMSVNVSSPTTTWATNIHGNDPSTDDNYLWSFWGSPYNLKIMNKTAGAGLYASTTSVVKDGNTAPKISMLEEGEGVYSSWAVVENTATDATDFCFRLNASPDGYVFNGLATVQENKGYLWEMQPNNSVNLTVQSSSATIYWVLPINDEVILTEVGFVDANAIPTIEDMPASFLYRFVDYKLYTDADMTQEVTKPMSGTIYVKMNGYNDYAPVIHNPAVYNDPATYQYYTIGNNSNGNCLYDNNGDAGSKSSFNVSTKNFHWAMIGTSPLGVKLYNRETGKYLSAVSLANDAALTLVENEADAITWELPYVSTYDAETQNNLLRFRVQGSTLYLNENSVKLTSNAADTKICHIIVPVTVFGVSDTHNAVDNAEYMLTYPGSAVRITTTTLDGVTNSSYRTHNYKHAFCDYTFYHSYNSTTGALTNGIPSTGEFAGIPFYGGSEQYPRAFYGTYEVSSRFDVEYLMGSGNTSYASGTLNTASTTVDGETLYYGYELASYNDDATYSHAKSDQTQAYRWVFSGDPYNAQIHNEKLGNDYYLGVPNMGWSSDAANKVRVTDNDTYGTYNTFEILDEGNNTYKFYLHQGNTERYKYGMGVYNGTIWNVSSSIAEYKLLPAIDQHALTWKVVDENGTLEEGVSYVNSYVSEGDAVTLDDMPASFIRQYCEYEFLGTSTSGSAVESYTMPTEDATVYVRYKLLSTAPTFYRTLGDYTATADADKKVYQVRLWNWNGSVKNLLYDNAGTLGSSTVPDVGNVDWALIGTPYNLQFYNKSTNRYINISDFSAIRPGNTIPMGDGTVGSMWEMLVDKTGDLAALRLKDDNGLLYIGLDATIDIEDNVNSASGADFACAPGLDGFTFRLKYHAATLRRNASNQPVAGQTENIEIRVYHEVDDRFLDILPARWKRPFCNYTFKYNDSEVDAITKAMTTASSGVTIDVTYTFDYGEGTSNFLWGKQGSGDDEKAKNVAGEQHGYYLVNHHGGEGNLLYMSDNVNLRVSEGFNRSAHLYTNNYQWTLVGDPYGCKVLCLYDPDNSYTQYLRVKDDGVNMEVNHTEDSNDLFELRTSLFANSFWLHPIYDSTLLTEETDENPVVHYVGINGQGNHPQLNTAPTTATPAKTTIASYRMEELLANHMADFVTYRGFVGGLNNECYKANKTQLDEIFTALKDGTATDEQKARIHKFIDDPDNLVQMAEGYYRIVPYVYEHNVDGLGTNRVYVRGYLYGKGDGLNTEDETVGANRQKALRINEAKTAALADPATIFYFKDFNAENGGCKISTQGLYLDGNMLYKAEPESNNCYYEDIGGCLVQLHTTDDKSGTPRYMSYRQNFMNNESDDDRSVNLMYCFQSNGYSRFYLQPIGTEEDNLEPLQMKTNNGQDGYYYSSLYVPYDVMLPEGAEAFAGLRDHTVNGKSWITCYTIDHFYAFKGDESLKRRFVPAGTPVLVRTKSTEPCDIMLNPQSPQNPSKPSTDDASTIAGRNIFKGTYLARVYASGDDEYNANGTVYVFGMGDVSSKVGFFRNKNKLDNGVVNNWYLKNNKMYYLDTSEGSSGAKSFALEFDEGELPTGIVRNEGDVDAPTDNRVYDLSGRRVEHPAKGVYIRNGRKIVIK